MAVVQMGGFWDDVVDVGSDAVDFAGDAVDAVLDVATSAVDTVGLRSVREELGDIAGDFFDSMEDVGEALRDAAPLILAAAATVSSFVPGIGTGVASALGTAAALAAGASITEALLAAATYAIPGGALVNAAVSTAITAGVALAEGKELDEALLEGTRYALVAAAGPIGGVAFDTTLAVAQGKALQDAGFAGLSAFVGGSDITDRALGYAGKIAKAAAENLPIEDILESDLVRDVYSSAGYAAADLLGPAVDRVKGDPGLMQVGSGVLAEMMGVSEPVARAAQAIMRDGTEDKALRGRFLTLAETVALGPNINAKKIQQRARGSIAYESELRVREAVESLALGPNINVRKIKEEARGSLAYENAKRAAAVAAVNARAAARAAAAKAAREAPRVSIVAAAPMVKAKPRTSLAGDLTLGGVVAGAGVALFLWARK